MREVQTLSMPVTMAQMVIFGLASIGGRQARRAPRRSRRGDLPAVLALRHDRPRRRAAALWPHVAALGWQALWVALILRLAAALFRRSVLKSGPRAPLAVADSKAALKPIAAFAASVSCAISALCGKGPWLMRATPAAAHSLLGGGAGEGDGVEWQGHLADDAFDMLRIGDAGDEEAARAGVGEGLAARDHLVDHLIVDRCRP